MNRIIKLGCIASGMLAMLVSCQKENISSQEKGIVNISIRAIQDDETKTSLTAEGVKWNISGEKLSVIEKAGSNDPKPYPSEDGVTTDEGATMTFGVSLPSSSESPFNYYALYPSSAFKDLSSSNKDWAKVELSSTQTPSATSFDGTKDILIAKPITGLNEQPTELEFAFKRMIAVGKMKISNLNSTENVLAVSFKATGKILSGRSYLNVTTGQAEQYGYYNPQDNVVLDYSGEDITANGMTAYFCVWPFSVARDEEISVTVTTDSKVFTKVIESPKALTFTEGKITSFAVNFDGIVGADNVKSNDGSLEKPFTAAEAITAINTGVDLTNKYVKGVITEVSSFNNTYGSITYNIESGEKTLLVYSGLDLGKAQFSAIDDLKVGDEVLVCGTLKKFNTTYEFDYNNYIVTLNGETEIYAGLKVSDQTTTFKVGDEFVFGGTVVQDWRGKDDVDVTSSASFSGYDMNTAGTQTVTVSVGEESTTYEITINSATAKDVTLGPDWNTLFGTSYSGSISTSANNLSLSGTNDGVTISVVNGTSTNGYVKTSDFRAYKGYTITLSVPEGKNITAISTTKGGKTFSSGISANTGKGSISNNEYSWSGSSQTVVLSISGTVSFATIVVTYE